ncbi:MAG: PQQ-binding-like beta-propeller repeat protein [Fimbriimonas sp.]
MASAKTLVAVALVALCALPASLWAQAKDFPTFQGSSQRVGHNADPNNSGPGLSFITWFRPRGLDRPKNVLLDNTDTLDAAYTGAFTGAPYDVNLSGRVFPSAGWNWVDIDREATFPFLMPRRVSVAPADYNDRFPSYYFTRTVASSTSSQTAAVDPARLRVFEWRFKPVDTTPRLYAINVWLPYGPTNVGTVGTPNNVFTQRYFVYEVLYGNNQRFVDVVDTDIAGAGNFRIGDGGRENRVVFPFDGVNPIRVRLYNTIPRDSAGNLLSDTTGGDNKYLVYADAVNLVPDFGNYDATPSSAKSVGTQVYTTAILNETSLGTRDGKPVTNLTGQVTQYDHRTGNVLWRYTPRSQSEATLSLDNIRAARSGLFSSSTASGNFQGVDYYNAPIQGASATALATYAPNLEDGTYELWAYLSGDRNGEVFGKGVRYQIVEGTAVSVVNVDQGGQSGWVRIGSRRYTHSSIAKLRVVVTNGTNIAADIGKKALADSIRFIGSVDLAIKSSPVHATVLLKKTPTGFPEETKVVLVADEQGRIHCLDAAGLPNGNTLAYWTYPSTPDASVTGWTDPNQVAGLDGPNGIAEMPSGFDITTALVERINGADYLYIGSKNGRVYCIDVTGRGDFNSLTGKPGTTTRRWSFPSDYPSTVIPSALGAFRGSVAFRSTSAGPTIFAPTTQGRLYALDALGNGTTKTTTTRWAFPALTEPTLGAISTSPTLSFNNVYFGTQKKGASPGEFWALNEVTGAPVWNVTYPPGTLPDGPFRGNVPPGETAFVETTDWLASPAAVSGATLDAVPGPGAGSSVDTIFAINQNRYVYAFDAQTGAVQWQTKELNTGAAGGLVYTTQNVFNNTGTRQFFPTIVVPTADGRFVGLFARTANVNRFGTRRAWQYTTVGRMTAGAAVSNGFLYGADQAGYLYAFSNDPSGGGEDPPGDEDPPENDPAGDLFRGARIRFITQEAFNLLRRPTTDTLTYAQSLNPSYTFVRTPTQAFDWGETMYLMVYDYPYATRDLDNNIVPPPTANFSFSVGGQTVRVQSAESRRFKEPPNAPTNTVNGAYRNNAYAIIQFPLQGGGANFLAPGNGDVTVSISTAALGRNGQVQNVALIPALCTAYFGVANPVGITMLNPDLTLQGSTPWIGNSTNPGLPENLMNGSQDIPGETIRRSLLGSSAGLVQHGLSKPAYINVYDRSLIATRTGRGLTNVRVQLQDLGWQGSSPAVYKPFNNTLFPNFEDYPVNYPNISLDYPDIRRESVRVTSDPNGTAGDPIFSTEGVSLKQPLVGGVPISDPSVADLLANRTFQSVPFQFAVDVPKYQPANVLRLTNPSSATPNHAGVFLDQGYMGRLSVGVQSGQSRGSVGSVVFGGNTPSAYRSFNLSAAVPPDEKITIGTPSVDLGAQASGTGYTPVAPGVAGSTFSPWTGAYTNLFKTFRVFNEGNVNLLNVRLAKYVNTGASVQPWQIPSSSNDSLAWLNGGLDLWSDIDRNFALANPNNALLNPVIIQKARVDDRSATELKTNPVRRTNANLNVTESALIPGVEPASPRVAVTLPLGFPSGKYSQILRVIEDANGDESLTVSSSNLALEAFSDPSMEVSFTARESRLTNTFTPFTAPMIDDLVPPGTTPAFTYANLQPTAMRDGFGGVAVAYVSNRPSFNPAAPTGASLNDEWRIYIASLRGTAPSGNDYRLNDLNGFQANGANRWFRQIVGNYPTTDPTILFQPQAGESLISGSAKFGSPSLPVQGLAHPFAPGTSFTGGLMAFVGEVQKQTVVGRQTDSRVFIARLDPAADGSVTVSDPVGLNADPGSLKSKPTVLQTQAGATVFYGSSAGGASSISWSFFDGTSFAPANALPFGPGFETVSSPSVIGRNYAGANAAYGPRIANLTFMGKLGNYPNVVPFMGLLPVDASGRPRTTGNPWAYFAVQTAERLTAATENSFRSKGVAWNRLSPLSLTQTLNGITSNLLLNGTDINGVADGSADTREFDQASGLITYQTRLGGRVVFDGSTGTVRFNSGTPNRNAVLRLTYQPTFLRISAASAASYASPTGMFDNRLVSSLDYWARSNGTAAQPSDVVTNDRFVFTYNRAAAGAGQAARPFLTTYRFGVRLGMPVNTLANGAVTFINVAGNTGPFQVDAANGVVYFTAADEDRNVTITFTGTDVGSGLPLPGRLVTATVSLVVERAEEPILMDQAINESGLTGFLDPFDALNARRPGLIWLFWTSTRAGTSDLFFQTIAPKLTPSGIN